MSEHATKVRKFFDRRVTAYDAFYEPASTLHRRFNRIFRKAVYLRRDQTMELAKRYGCKSVLEVGCGSGQNAVWFVRNGAERVTGVDISSEMVDKATELAAAAGVSDRCVFQHNDFLAMAEGPRFDLVVAVGVFDYVEDSRTFLTHMMKFADRVVYVSFPGWTWSDRRCARFDTRCADVRLTSTGAARLRSCIKASALAPWALSRSPAGTWLGPMPKVSTGRHSTSSHRCPWVGSIE